MDDAEAYLRKAAQLQKKKFGPNGILTAPVPCAVSRLPLRKRRRGSEGGRSEAAPSSDGSRLETSSALPHVISLVDKYFPGNTLKVNALWVGCSPPSEYVDATVAKVGAIREKMLTLRNGIEDLDTVLNSSRSDVSEEIQLASAQTVLQQFVAKPPNSLGSTRKQINAYQSVRKRIQTPVSHKALEWHAFLNENGPERSSHPYTSLFLWTSSAGITALFTVLTQRFLKKVDPDTLLHKFRPEEPNPSDLMESQRKVLCFMKAFMPTGTADVRDTSGFFSWMMACFAFLDTPLDPDSDRLASRLFQCCCDIIWIINYIAQLPKEGGRGALLHSLQTPSKSILNKTYHDYGDVDQRELYALYSVAITLSKIFRQNQNSAIAL